MTRELFVEENRGSVRRRVDRNGKERKRNTSIRKNVNSIVGFKKRRTKKNDEVYRDMVSRLTIKGSVRVRVRLRLYQKIPFFHLKIINKKSFFFRKMFLVLLIS